MSSVGEIIFSGPLLAALPLALAAGFLAFASPCVLPLVPGYLGYVSGFRGGVETTRPTRRLVIGVLLFIAGFSTVFISFSIAFASLGALLIGWIDVIIRVAGLLVILMGFVFIGQVSFLQRAVTLPLAGTSGFVGGTATRDGFWIGVGSLHWTHTGRHQYLGPECGGHSPSGDFGHRILHRPGCPFFY